MWKRTAILVALALLSACANADRASVDDTCKYYSHLGGSYVVMRFSDIPVSTFLPVSDERHRQVIEMAYGAPVERSSTAQRRQAELDITNKIFLLCYQEKWREVLPLEWEEFVKLVEDYP